jgi:hypothetical protein
MARYRYEVKHNPRDDSYGEGWTVIRFFGRNTSGGLEVGAYRTPQAAEHAAASLRWAQVIDS